MTREFSDLLQFILPAAYRWTFEDSFVGSFVELLPNGRSRQINHGTANEMNKQNPIVIRSLIKEPLVVCYHFFFNVSTHKLLFYNQIVLTVTSFRIHFPMALLRLIVVASVFSLLSFSSLPLSLLCSRLAT